MKFHKHIFIIYACCALLPTPGVSQEHFTTHKQLKGSDVSVRVITIKNGTAEVCSRLIVGGPVPHKDSAITLIVCGIVKVPDPSWHFRMSRFLRKAKAMLPYFDVNTGVCYTQKKCLYFLVNG